MVTVKDWGSPEYLDGAEMQFSVWRGSYSSPVGEIVAYVASLDDAIKIAHALAIGDESVIIEGPS